MQMQQNLYSQGKKVQGPPLTSLASLPVSPHNFEGQITVGAFLHSQLFAGTCNEVRSL